MARRATAQVDRMAISAHLTPFLLNHSPGFATFVIAPRSKPLASPKSWNQIESPSNKQCLETQGGASAVQRRVCANYCYRLSILRFHEPAVKPAASHRVCSASYGIVKVILVLARTSNQESRFQQPLAISGTLAAGDLTVHASWTGHLSQGEACGGLGKSPDRAKNARFPRNRSAGITSLRVRHGDWCLARFR